MECIELHGFAKRVFQLLDEENLLALQVELMRRPDAGDLIVHGGGLRKIRWSATGRGKRGGVRVIYYWRTAAGQIILADIYPKNEKESLTQAEVSSLKKQLEL